MFNQFNINLIPEILQKKCLLGYPSHLPHKKKKMSAINSSVSCSKRIRIDPSIVNETISKSDKTKEEEEVCSVC